MRLFPRLVECLADAGRFRVGVTEDDSILVGEKSGRWRGAGVQQRISRDEADKGEGKER